MKAWHWAIWGIGWCATLAMIVGIPVLKGGPDWYAPILIVAAGYCLAARAAMAYLRRTSRGVPAREMWLRALATARVGFLVVVAIVVVTAGIFLLGLVAK